MTMIWLGIIIVLILLERVYSNFVTIFFAGSAVISLILSLFMDSFLIEFLIFIILGLILLVTTRDKVVKIIKDKKVIKRKRGKNEK